MLSRPDSSRLKPVPTSKSAATRPPRRIRAGRRLGDPRQDLQECRLAGAVMADGPPRTLAGDGPRRRRPGGPRDTLRRRPTSVSVTAEPAVSRPPEPQEIAQRRAQGRDRRGDRRFVTPGGDADPVELADVSGLNDGVFGHRMVGPSGPLAIRTIMGTPGAHERVGRAEPSLFRSGDVGEEPLSAAEVKSAGGQQDGRDDQRLGKLDRAQLVRAEQAVPEGRDDARPLG